MTEVKNHAERISHGGWSDLDTGLGLVVSGRFVLEAAADGVCFFAFSKAFEPAADGVPLPLACPLLPEALPRPPRTRTDARLPGFSRK